MGRIYTKGGDKGLTSIHGGERVEKDDVRIEANGTLDELNASIGVVLAHISMLNEDNIDYLKQWIELLIDIQTRIMTVMSLVATPSTKRELNPNKFNSNFIDICEKTIDEINAKTTDNGFFILPGGTLISAHLQLSRTIARRAERRLWTLNRIDHIPSDILIFINRLSDLFFIMARYDMQMQNCNEHKWKKFNYKRDGKKA